MKFFNHCEKAKILPATYVIPEVKQTKILRTALICLIVIAIFTQVAVAVRPLNEQDESLVPLGKAALCSSMKGSRKAKPDLVGLGDPIEDPLPHKH
ncbi:MAG: hypothetical protein JSW29_03645 [Candidatus Bathyarchaeota archaeon]|nr:MAG: hypothetical protein JSW29_03645 [Candidatus Bathyarchaeota archaeon]